MNEMAKMIILAGVALVVLGLIIAALGKIPGVGRLPGDILVKKENFTFYFPLATCILVSLVLTVVMQLFRK